VCRSIVYWGTAHLTFVPRSVAVVALNQVVLS